MRCPPMATLQPHPPPHPPFHFHAEAMGSAESFGHPLWAVIPSAGFGRPSAAPHIGGHGDGTAGEGFPQSGFPSAFFVCCPKPRHSAYLLGKKSAGADGGGVGGTFRDSNSPSTFLYTGFPESFKKEGLSQPSRICRPSSHFRSTSPKRKKVTSIIIAETRAVSGALKIDGEDVKVNPFATTPLLVKVGPRPFAELDER